MAVVRYENSCGCGIPFASIATFLSVFQSDLSVPAGYASIETAAFERKEVKLADGSIILLNRKSELHYPEKFEGESREVYLVGEAFLEVAQMPEKPFIVHTKDANVVVMGTSFNLQERGRKIYSKEELKGVKLYFTAIPAVSYNFRF